MNKENVLFSAAGVFLGFIIGYFVAEGRQQHLGGPAVPPAAMDDVAVESGASPTLPPGFMEELEEAKSAVDREPANRQAVVKLANLYFDIEHHEQAAEQYRRALELKPDDPDVLTDLGISMRNLGKSDDALMLFEKAQRLKPGHPQSLINQLVVHLFDRKDYPKSRKLLTEIKTIIPNEPVLAKFEEALDAAEKVDKMPR